MQGKENIKEKESSGEKPGMMSGLFGKGKITEKEKEKEMKGGSGNISKEKMHSHGHEGECNSSEFVEALCPIEGNCVSKSGPHADTPQAVLKHQQRVFFCSVECCDKFKDDVPKFMREPGDPKWCEKPCMSGLTVACSECKNGSQLKITECTPRILLKHGQTLWFCNFSCMASFLKNPTSGFQPSLTSTFAGLVLGEHRATGLTAVCPVTGKKVAVESGIAHIEFAGGQRIYTCGSSCPLELSRGLMNFIKRPHDPFVHSSQLVLTGLIQKCPCCSHTLVIDEEHTPRVQFRGGQNIFLHSNKCVDEFLVDPNKFIINVVAEQQTISSTTGKSWFGGRSTSEQEQQQQQQPTSYSQVKETTYVKKEEKPISKEQYSSSSAQTQQTTTQTKEKEKEIQGQQQQLGQQQGGFMSGSQYATSMGGSSGSHHVKK